MNHSMRIPLAALLCASMSSSAVADEKAQSYNIPAQPLHSALQKLADQAGVAVFFSEHQVNGKTSPALIGQYSAREALQKLLAGSGLTYIFTDEDSVSIKAPESGSAEASSLPAVNVTGKPVYSSADPRSSEYVTTRSSTATKTDSLLIETPLAVQTVPKSVMSDQKTSTLKEALENISSVRPQPSIGVFNGFIIRGMPDFIQYRNGLRVSYTEFDTANLERLDVLKGPAAVLFGRAEPGGLVNMVTKQPQAEPYYSLEQRFASYDTYRTEWDATGSINAEKSLQYRFSGASQSNNSFRDYLTNDQFQLHSALKWQISDKTQVGLDVEGFKKEFRSDQGLPAIGNRPAALPITRSIQDPNDPLDKVSNVFVGLNFSHQFNDNWTLRNRFQAHFRDFDLFDTVAAFFDASALRPHNGSYALDRTLFYQVAHQDAYGTNLDLTGKFDFGGTKHETLFGFDYYHMRESYNAVGDFSTADPTLTINDIFNPVEHIDPSRFNRAAILNDPNAFISYQRAKEEWFGIYFQDQVTLWEKLHLLGGGRYDWASTGRGRSGISFADAESLRDQQYDSQFSPRFGILYQITDWASIYGNWSQSFGANNGVSSTGQAFEPQHGEQFETGLKTSWFEDRLNASVAYYHLTKNNLLTSNLATTDDPTDQIAVGHARSQGIELDVNGRLTDYLSLIGNYAFTDARFTQDFSGYQDHKLAGSPEHSGSLWLKYDHEGSQTRRGLSLGVGVFAADRRMGDNENTFLLPGYARLDASAGYSWQLAGKRLTTQLNVRNLLDKTYYESTDPFSNAPPRLGIFPGAPITFVGSVKLEY